MSEPDRHILRVPANTLLFREGDRGAEAYLIVDGAIEIFLEREGGEHLLARLGPCELVGEMAMIDAGPRSASARTASDCSLVTISSEQFATRLAETDPVLRMCLNVILDRHRSMIARFHTLEPNPRELAGRGRDFGGAMATLTLERELRSALAAGEIFVFYQPIIALETGRVAGFEALARWRHPERGLVGPDAFIGVAEASGLIPQLTAGCIGQIARDFPELGVAALGNAVNVDAPFVHVNISARDLAEPGFAARVTQALGGLAPPPGGLRLEVTESALMRDPEAACSALEECRRAGFGVAIDDFGTGYSSLAQIGRLPISTIKIDLGFVQRMASDPVSAKIVDLILHLGRDLDMAVIAEGVETADQAARLVASGCGYAQGFLFGDAQPLDVTLERLASWRAGRVRARYPDIAPETAQRRRAG